MTHQPSSLSHQPAQPADLPDLDLSCLDLTALPVKPKIVTVTVEGIVEAEDLAQLIMAPPQGASPGDLAKIKEKHHAVARLIASGMTQRLAATIAGYTETYLSLLLNNPAMQELVAHYRASHGNASEAIAHKLRNLAMGATEQLGERMESEELTNQELLQLAKLGLDRSGHGPSSTQHTVTESHILDHAELQRLNREARKASREDIIDLPAAAPALPSPRQEAGE